MKGKLKLGFCIGVICLMLIGCQSGIRSYIGAVGLTRVHADELIIYPVIPLTEAPVHKETFITTQANLIKSQICAAAREEYVRAASGSDRSSDLGDSYVVGEGYEDPEGYIEDADVYREVAEDDSWQDLTYLGTWTATAYCSCVECTTDGNGYTASGTIATEGRTIACNVLPMGTEVLIDGHTYIVEDTGWSPYGDAWLDIYFESHDAALAFGVQTVEIYVKE